MTTPERVIREDIRAISAYHVEPAEGMVKLDAMENPYRLPDALRAAIADLAAGAEVNRYPDPGARRLKQLIGRVMRIPEGCDLLLGNGSDEIIQLVALAAARAGALVMAPEPGFVMYRLSAQFARIGYAGFSLEPDFSLDAERFCAAMAEHRPSVVFIAYPNNPTGNLFPEAALERIVERAPGLVVIDEAYQPFAGRTFMPRLNDFPNLMVMRTVSKLGLAGLRLGYAAARPEWVTQFDKLRPPYNVGVLTQLVAERLLEEHDTLDAQAAAIRSDRAALAAELARVPGVTQFPSDANFILLRVPDAPRVFDALKARRVLVRSLHGSHRLLADCLRVTVGTPEENAAFVRALREALAAR